MKKRLTQSEEFEIMKIVLDKFLWLGFAIMGYGFYIILTKTTAAMDYVTKGLITIAIGVILLILFMILIIKEYEIVK